MMDESTLRRLIRVVALLLAVLSLVSTGWPLLPLAVILLAIAGL
jgi:hypothetical protein